MVFRVELLNNLDAYYRYTVAALAIFIGKLDIYNDILFKKDGVAQVEERTEFSRKNEEIFDEAVVAALSFYNNAFICFKTLNMLAEEIACLSELNKISNQKDHRNFIENTHTIRNKIGNHPHDPQIFITGNPSSWSDRGRITFSATNITYKKFRQHSFKLIPEEDAKLFYKYVIEVIELLNKKV